MLFRALAFATFLASSATADNDSFLRGDRLLGKPSRNTLGECATLALGNGFPSGKFAFKLNLLGKTKDINYKPQGGNNIAIALDEACKGKDRDNCTTSAITKIMLYNSGTNPVCTKEYEVFDANGLDGEAGLCLPDPFASDEPCINNGPDADASGPCDEPAAYAVYARVRGKGSFDVKLCAEDANGTVLCPVGIIETVDSKRAQDISQALLTACIDVDGDGDDDGVGLFDKLNGEDADYFWELDNYGVRNAELRFFDLDTLRASCDGDEECENCYKGVTRANACS